MSLETIRTDLVTAIVAIKATYPDASLLVEYDNRISVDLTKQLTPYLTVDFKVLNGEQADLSNNPIHRYSGVITLSAGTKEGKGSLAAYKLLDFFSSRLQRTGFGTVRTHLADAAPTSKQLGWIYYSAVVPFWSDQQT